MTSHSNGIVSSKVRRNQGWWGEEVKRSTRMSMIVQDTCLSSFSESGRWKESWNILLESVKVNDFYEIVWIVTKI